MKYVLLGFILLTVLSLMDLGIKESKKAWKNLKAMNYPRTPSNLLLYLYCQYEAVSRINMDFMHNWLKN